MLVATATAAAVPTTQESDAPLPTKKAPATSPCDEPLDVIDAAATPIDRVKARIVAAQCLLTRASAPPLTSLVAIDSLDRRALDRISADALKHIDAAARELDAAELEDDARDEQVEELDCLRAFAEMFAALAVDPDSDDASRRLTDACIGLALYADDPREQIVESAKLWQAVAYRRACKPDRALQVLRPVLGAPSARIIGFYSRVIRCRALADRRNHAAAIALALRLGHRADVWFNDRDRATRRLVADSMRWLKIELYMDWAEFLRSDGKPERAADAEDEARLLIGDDEYPVAADAWLPLELSIAGLAESEPGYGEKPSIDEAPGEKVEAAEKE